MTAVRPALRANLVRTLCRWDLRNPDRFQTDESDPSGPLAGCACDACFYGRHRLADIALGLLGELEGIK